MRISSTPSEDANDIEWLANHQALRRAVRPFGASITRQSLWQLANSFLGFLVLWAAMYLALGVSYWLTLALAVPAAGFVVRIFIIQHDCGHGSFFRSARANKIAGRVCSLVTMTPFQNWRHQHTTHHRISNNLDRRTGGPDMFAETHTTAEYWQMSPRERLLYRVSRHPLVCHVLVPPLVFMVLYRTPFDTPPGCQRERRSVLLTNAALAMMFGGLAYGLGFKTLLMVHLPIIALAAIAGIWLFAVQHRFDETHWYREEDWNFATAALTGTSWLRLPKILQWFSGNIGLHHVHHLHPKIPNYRLQACLEALPELQQARCLSLRQALGASRYWLWDEVRGRMVRFNESEATMEPVPS